MRQFFLQSVYILWTHARSVLSPSPLKCIKEKKKKKKGRNGAVYFEMHLNLTEPLQAQTDTSAAERGWVRGGVQTADPAAKVCIPRQRSTDPRNCGTFIAAADVQEAAWLVARASLCQSVGE